MGNVAFEPVTARYSPPKGRCDQLLQRFRDPLFVYVLTLLTGHAVS